MEEVEVRCPKCGNTDLDCFRLVEWVPVLYDYVHRGGNVLVFGTHHTDFAEPKDRGLVCVHDPDMDDPRSTPCMTHIEIPDCIQIEFATS